MGIAKDNESTNAMGGTELLKHELENRLPSELLNKFQIFVSRVHEDLDETKLRLLWCHDLAADPSNNHLHNSGWNKFHRIIFVSHTQMNEYINMYKIPHSKCVVLLNAINPIEKHEKPKDVIRLGYWSTPHRGLNILLPVFNELCNKYSNIELDVYSSFKIYGRDAADEHYQDLYDFCNNHDKINYHGSVSNSIIRERIKNIHILAYPSIWQETSCLTLMEAMSGGCLPVHSDLGALPETAANWTLQYRYDENLNDHAAIFYRALDLAISTLYDEGIQSRIASMQAYANVFYNWDTRIQQWIALMKSIENELTDLPKPTFNYTSLQS